MKKCFFLFLLSLFCFNLFGQKQFRKHYYYRIEQFNNEVSITSKDVVFLGDSITEGGEWESYFSDKLNGEGKIFNRGISGDITDGVIARLDKILSGRPKKIFLMIGINDINNDLTPDKILENYTKIVEEIRSKSPETQLFLQSVLPVNAEIVKSKVLKRKTHSIIKVNRGIKKIARKNNAKYINVYERVKAPGSLQLDPLFTYDGLHLNKKGYSIWCKAIEKYVK